MTDGTESSWFSLNTLRSAIGLTKPNSTTTTTASVPEPSVTHEQMVKKKTLQVNLKKREIAMLEEEIARYEEEENVEMLGPLYRRHERLKDELLRLQRTRDAVTEQADLVDEASDMKQQALLTAKTSQTVKSELAPVEKMDMNAIRDDLDDSVAEIERLREDDLLRPLTSMDKADEMDERVQKRMEQLRLNKEKKQQQGGGGGVGVGTEDVEILLPDAPRHKIPTKGGLREKKVK